MKQEIKELIEELADMMPALARDGQYGSMRVYAAFTADMAYAFADLFLTDREEPNEDEIILAGQIIHNPLLGPLAVRNKIEQKLGLHR